MCTIMKNLIFSARYKIFIYQTFDILKPHNWINSIIKHKININ